MGNILVLKRLEVAGESLLWEKVLLIDGFEGGDRSKKTRGGLCGQEQRELR